MRDNVEKEGGCGRKKGETGNTKWMFHVTTQRNLIGVYMAPMALRLPDICNIGLLTYPLALNIKGLIWGSREI